MKVSQMRGVEMRVRQEICYIYNHQVQGHELLHGSLLGFNTGF